MKTFSFHILFDVRKQRFKSGNSSIIKESIELYRRTRCSDTRRQADCVRNRDGVHGADRSSCTSPVQKSSHNNNSGRKTVRKYPIPYDKSFPEDLLHPHSMPSFPLLFCSQSDGECHDMSSSLLLLFSSMVDINKKLLFHLSLMCTKLIHEGK